MSFWYGLSALQAPHASRTATFTDHAVALTLQTFVLVLEDLNHTFNSFDLSDKLGPVFFQHMLNSKATSSSLGIGNLATNNTVEEGLDSVCKLRLEERLCRCLVYNVK